MKMNKMEKALQIQRILNEGQGLATLKEKLSLLEDVNITWGSGINLAHTVAQNAGKLPYPAREVLGVLREVGVDLEAGNGEGKTPLHLAVLLRNVEAVEAFLGAGVNPNRVNHRGVSPLFDAVMQFTGGPEQLRIIELLLRAGADPDISNLSGHSARSVVEDMHQRLLTGIGEPEWDLKPLLKW